MIKDDESVGGVTAQDLHTNTAAKPEETPQPVSSYGGANPSNNNFEAMEEDHQDLWLDRVDQENLIDVNDTSIFYNDFPPLPDFPCMSSSSSSSSVPAKHAVATTSSSSSTSSPAASWAVLKSDSMKNAVPNNQLTKMGPTSLSATSSMDVSLAPENDLDCIDVMENFCYMDLFDNNEIWDPSSVFQTENDQYLENNVDTVVEENVQLNNNQSDGDNDGFSFIQKDGELAMIFLEWLKQNKDYISAEDMRNIKLKRSTIETASKRLGTSKEGKKQLLKLILEWVEQYQLQKKKMQDASNPVIQTNFPNFREPVRQTGDPNPNPNPNFSYGTPVAPDPIAGYPANPWIAPAVPAPDGAPMMVQSPAPSFSVPMAAYGTPDPYNTMLVPPMNQVVNGIPYPNPVDYTMMDTQPWAQPTFPMQPPPAQFNQYPENVSIMPQQQGYYGHPYQAVDPNGERFVRLGSSATKEARKKRMARQRQLYTHSRRNSSPSQHHGLVDDTPQVDVGGENADGTDSFGSNWAYWTPDGPSAGIDATQSGDRAARQIVNSSTDKRQQQSWKTEKNLKFLLQKVLKQSDVGNLGRIVLPKKEAETHLPELESRDGMPIAMEDIGTSRVWNMRYRFWPNNKSRMYLLENTGDFVRVNGLQEGDFIVIYSDTKCGKYMIRGVKVRQPGAKQESKKMSRRNSRSLSFAGNSSSLAPIKQAVR